MGKVKQLHQEIEEQEKIQEIHSFIDKMIEIYGTDKINKAIDELGIRLLQK